MHIGATLGRRFTLLRPEEADLPGIDRYVAGDARLGTEVYVDIVTAVAPSAVRQKAARAAQVRDPRLARVVSTEHVTGDERFTYIVHERPTGTRLDTVMDSRVLAPAAAAAIVVETARALAVASAQGVHHGYLRPAAISVTRRSRVTVSGLGIDGELASQAHLRSGSARAEGADSLALGRLYVEAITGLDPDDARTDDLPDGLSASALALCEKVLSGTAPRHLREIVAALQPHSTRALADFASAVKTLPWRPAIIEAERERLAEIGAWSRENCAIAADTIQSATHLAALRSIGHLAQPGLATLVRQVTQATELATPPGVGLGAGEVDDLDTFDLMVADQNAEPQPAVWEELLEYLHERWPRSERVTRSLVWARERAERSGPINAGPLLMALSVAVIVIAAMVAFSLMSQPFVPDFDLQNPPRNTYPEFTYSPSVDATVSPEISE